MHIKKLIPALLCAVMALSGSAVLAETVPYQGYTYNAEGESVPAPAPYLVQSVLKGTDFGCGALNAPQDLFVTAGGDIYIADTGNNRIVILDSRFHCVKAIQSVLDAGKPQKLSGPSGVFVSKDGTVYIADTGNKRILKLDAAGRVLQTFARPKSDLYGSDLDFKPEKLAVDSTGYVYCYAYGVYDGLVEYDNTGKFVGFYGSNKVSLSLQNLTTYMWKQVFSKSQSNAMIQLIPTEYSNVFIDENDFIYTSTHKTDNSLDEIKKMNALGDNVLRYPTTGVLYPHNNFGDIEQDTEKGNVVDSKFDDVEVDADGIISALDTERCRIFQYDQDCNMLFVFGDKGSQRGMFLKPTAIEKTGDDYLVLDASMNSLTVMEPTAYAKLVRQATLLYNDGRYTDSTGLWKEVLKLNSNCSLAYSGIGKALLQQKDYKQAMYYLKLGQDRNAYSDAYRAYRKIVVRKYFFLIVALVAAALVAVGKLLRLLLKKLGFCVQKKHMVFR